MDTVMDSPVVLLEPQQEQSNQDDFDVCVIVPVFNRPEHTQVCLDSFFDVDPGDVRMLVVVVDNSSRLRTKTIIADWLAKYQMDEAFRKRHSFKVVTRENNGGFAAAVNVGLAVSGHDKRPVVIMHNDCVPFKGWLGEMLEVLRSSDDDAAVVVPRTNYANEGAPCVQDIRKAFEKLKPPNKDRLTPSEIRDIMAKTYPDGQEAVTSLLKLEYPNTMRSSFCVEISSFCMLVRQGLFSKYGFFDEEFWPRGYEDKLWFIYLEREGYVCMVANHAFVHHHGNATSDGPGFVYPEIMKLNEERFKAKLEARDRSRGLPGAGTAV
jgi:GT2 family glycosyltransferase